MKKIIIAALLVAATGRISAQEVSDTTNIVSPDSVTIITEGNNIFVKVYGQENDSLFFYEKDFVIDSEEPVVTKKTHTVDDFSLPLYTPNTDGSKSELSVDIGLSVLLGQNFAMNAPKNMNLSKASYEVWLPNVLTYRYNPHNSRFSFSWDWGFDWRNFRLEDSTRFIADEEGTVSIGNYPENAKRDFSRIKIHSGTWTFLVKYNFGGFGHLQAGPVVSFNQGSILTKYMQDNETKRDKTKNLKVTPITVDWVGALSVDGVGFYIKYSPQNLFRKDWGPQFSALTVGVKWGW